MAPITDIQSTIGPMFLGMAIGLALWGVSCIQTWYYYDNYKRDTLYMKTLVALVFISDTIHQGIICWIIYRYTISFFGDVVHVQSVDKGIYIEVLFNAFTGTMVQCFFTYRIWQFRKQTVLISVISLLILGELAVSLAYALQGLVEDLDDFAKIRKLKGLSMSINVLAAVGDLMICGSICRMLNSSKTGHAWSNHALNRLMIFSVNTGLVTSICACCSLLFILVLDEKYFVYACFYFIIGRLYSNSFLATLNARRRIRGGATDEDESDALPLAAFSLSRKQPLGLFCPCPNGCASLAKEIPITTRASFRYSPHHCTNCSHDCSHVSYLSSHPSHLHGSLSTLHARRCTHPYSYPSSPSRLPTNFHSGVYTEPCPRRSARQHVRHTDTIQCVPEQDRRSCAHHDSRVCLCSTRSCSRGSRFRESPEGLMTSFHRHSNDLCVSASTPLSVSRCESSGSVHERYKKASARCSSGLLGPFHAEQVQGPGEAHKQNRDSSRSSWRLSASILSPLTIWKSRPPDQEERQEEEERGGLKESIHEDDSEVRTTCEEPWSDTTEHEDRETAVDSLKRGEESMPERGENDDQDIADITDSYINTDPSPSILSPSIPSPSIPSPSIPPRYSLHPLQTTLDGPALWNEEITPSPNSAQSSGQRSRSHIASQYGRRPSVASHRRLSEIRCSVYTQTEDELYASPVTTVQQARWKRGSTFGVSCSDELETV